MANKQDMYARITAHGENLKNLFRLPADTDPIKLCKQLRRIEAKASRAAEDYCNGDLTMEDFEAFEAKTLKAVDKLLGHVALGVPVFVNGDPRGYALKIRAEWVRDGYALRPPVTLHRDLGGYGILAPDLSN